MHSSNGVFLRRITESDLETMFECRNSLTIRQWCRQNAPLHWENHQAWYKAQSKDPSISMFAVETEEQFFAGVVGLTSIDLVNKRAEFSCYVSPEFQGQGIGKASLLLLLYHGFYDLGLNRIWGETYDGNPAINLFKSLGMELEGSRKEFYYRNGRFIDCHLISLNRAMFDALHLSKTAAEA